MFSDSLDKLLIRLTASAIAMDKVKVAKVLLGFTVMEEQNAMPNITMISLMLLRQCQQLLIYYLEGDIAHA